MAVEQNLDYCIMIVNIRTIVALVYNVLKTMMEGNAQLFDELTSSYKADRQRLISQLLGF